MNVLKFKADDFLTPEELCALLKLPPNSYRSDLKMFRRFKPIHVVHGHPRFLRSFVMQVLANEVRHAGLTNDGTQTGIIIGTKRRLL